MKTKPFLLPFALLISLSCSSQINITFTVDVTGFPVYGGGMHIAGQFVSSNSTSITEEWQPHASGSFMTLLYGNTYGVTVSFPSTSAGDSLQFQFVRDSAWGNNYGDMSEGNPFDYSVLLNGSCGINDPYGGWNRFIFIPTCGGEYDCLWNQCGYVAPAPCDSIDFMCSATNICEKFCVDFTDQSGNNPVAWQWSFPGGNPSSSTDQNPVNICYNLPGSYEVTLIATYTSGNDTLTLPDYIHVNATPPIPTIEQDGYTLTSSPAAYYQWQLNTIDIPGATGQSYQVMQTGYYTVVVSDERGCDNSATLWVQITGMNEINDGFALSVFPNPFSQSTDIRLLLASPENVSLKIFDAQGKLIRILADGNMSEGEHTLTWDAGNKNGNAVSSGIYFLKMETPAESKTISLSVVK